MSHADTARVLYMRNVFLKYKVALKAAVQKLIQPIAENKVKKYAF